MKEIIRPADSRSLRKEKNLWFAQKVHSPDFQIFRTPTARNRFSFSFGKSR
jgi:hypothetical protein